MNTKPTFKYFGVFGIVGGVILCSGDLLFYWHPESTNLLKNLGESSHNRIILSTVCALFASWFYSLGSLQIYYAFKKSKPTYKYLTTLLTAAIGIAYGVIHAAYTAIATSAKIALQNNLDVHNTTALAWETNHVLRGIVYPLFILLSILFIHQVWNHKTLYPRWMLLFFPLLPLLLTEIFLSKLLTGKAWVLIMGGHYNLLFIVFFSASTLALWKSDKS